MLLSQILNSSITSFGRPIIFSLLSNSFTFTTSKAALRSILDIKAYLFWSKAWDSKDWMVNPAVTVLFPFLKPC